jgi:hypothetical protein
VRVALVAKSKASLAANAAQLASSRLNLADVAEIAIQGRETVGFPAAWLAHGLTTASFMSQLMASRGSLGRSRRSSLDGVHGRSPRRPSRKAYQNVVLDVAQASEHTGGAIPPRRLTQPTAAPA